eukprot:5543550-Amphidinium_carterae.1
MEKLRRALDRKTFFHLTLARLCAKRFADYIRGVLAERAEAQSQAHSKSPEPVLPSIYLVLRTGTVQTPFCQTPRCPPNSKTTAKTQQKSHIWQKG